MSWKEFLTDLDTREMEERSRFIDRLVDGAAGPEETYPAASRFPGFDPPIATAGACNVWGIIPFQGQVVAPIVPGVNEADFNLCHNRLGITSDRLGSVLDYARQTRRLGFCLAARPLEYVGQEFLQPLFEEFRPPVHSGFPMEELVGQEPFYAEFLVFVDTEKNLVRCFASEIAKLGIRESRLVSKCLMGFFANYLFLRECGYKELADLVEANFSTSPSLAIGYNNVFGAVVGSPSLDMARFLRVHDQSEIELASQFFSPGEQPTDVIGNPSRPGYDVGVYLLKKMLPCPETMEACIEITDAFDTQKLSSLRSVLFSAVAKSDPSKVYAASTELQVECDQVWSRLDRYRWVERTGGFGMSVALGLAGPLAGAFLGMGVLADLGLVPATVAVERILGSTFSVRARSVAASLLGRNHLFSLYNFKARLAEHPFGPAVPRDG